VMDGGCDGAGASHATAAREGHYQSDAGGLEAQAQPQDGGVRVRDCQACCFSSMSCQPPCARARQTPAPACERHAHHARAQPSKPPPSHPNPPCPHTHSTLFTRDAHRVTAPPTTSAATTRSDRRPGQRCSWATRALSRRRSSCRRVVCEPLHWGGKGPLVVIMSDLGALT
jgi:hypothetical protein